MTRLTLLAAVLLAAPAAAQTQTPREKKVRDDKTKVEADGYWIYNDLPKAFAAAKASGKPIVAVLRCVPCEECVKLDDELVNTDPELRPLLDQFVRVRVVSTNGLDLSLFQFDTDQSFACFLLNADGTIYGRFGTRSHRTNWVGDVSVPGLAKALAGALELHADFPKHKPALAAKRGPAPAAATPELLPGLKGKYAATLNYAGNVVQSCIHCHQIGDAVKAAARAAGPLSDELLFPYPHPKSQGMVFDPKERATLAAVTAGSAAAASGFDKGDIIRTLDGQPMLSIADAQWVLHRTPADATTLVAEIVRNGKLERRGLKLPTGWKAADDISWRASSWGLRRMAAGGLVLESAGDGLRVKHVGQYGPHAAAKTAGFKVGDVLVSFDGKAGWKRETDLLAYALKNRRPGDAVPVVVSRDGRDVSLTLPMQP